VCFRNEQKLLQASDRGRAFDEPLPLEPMYDINQAPEVMLDRLIKSELRVSNLASHLKDYRLRIEDLRRLVSCDNLFIIVYKFIYYLQVNLLSTS